MNKDGQLTYKQDIGVRKDLATFAPLLLILMTVIIKGPPPIRAVASLRQNGCIQVYALLWESAYMDTRIDKRRKISKKDRRDCGGASEWSIKALAGTLSLGERTVRNAVKTLLEYGFISVDGLIPTGKGSPKRLFRVTPPSELDNRRAVISVMGTESLDSCHLPRTQEFLDPSDLFEEDSDFNDFLEITF